MYLLTITIFFFFWSYKMANLKKNLMYLRSMDINNKVIYKFIRHQTKAKIGSSSIYYHNFQNFETRLVKV